MKKQLKIITGLLVLVLMVSMLAGCGGGGNGGGDVGNGGDDKVDDKMDITGTWSAVVDLTDKLDLGEDFADFNSKLEINMLYDFKNDGTLVFQLDEKNLSSAMNKLIDEMIDFVILAQAEAMDMSYEEFDETGSTIDEFMRAMLESEMDWSNLMTNLVDETMVIGKYKVDGNKLYSVDLDEDFDDSDYIVIELSGNTLKFVSSTDPDFNENEIMKLPFSLTRVK